MKKREIKVKEKGWRKEINRNEEMKGRKERMKRNKTKYIRKRRSRNYK